MKKRLFMVFTLSVFIVSIMAAAAMAAKPTFTNGSDIASSVAELEHNKAVSLTLHANASPDLTKVTVSDTKPLAGITISVGTITTDTESSDCPITISGTPSEASKGKKVTITATNKDGSTSLKLTFNSTSTDISISTVSGTLPGSISSGGTYVFQNEKLTDVTLHAEPGPITWKVKDLPKGITTKTTSTDITLKGTYTGATAFSKAIGVTSNDAKKYHFTITASNKAVENTASVSGDIFVIASPDITTKSLPVLTTGKEYRAKIAIKNYPKDVQVYFVPNNTTAYNTTLAGKNTTKVASAIKIVASNDNGTTTDINDGSWGALTFSSEDMTITGSLDKVPVGGKLYVKVWAQNLKGGAVSKDIPIEVKGVAPVFEKPENLDLDEGEVVFMIKKGTRPLVVSIDVDAKTRQSYSTDKTLKDANIVSGTQTTDTAFNELGFSYKAESGSTTDDFLWKATLKPITPTAATVAESYKKLKLTLRATNPATGTKEVKKQFGINRSADMEIVWKQGTSAADPSATAGNDVTGTTINIKNVTGGEELEANNDAKKAIPAGIALDTNGNLLATNTAGTHLTKFYTNIAKPYTIALSGDVINGIGVSFDASNKILSIRGTPTKSKDTVTKLKLVATNTLTKKKAQVNVNLYAYDRPVFKNSDDLGKGKEVVAGKKISIKGTPKAHKDLLSTFTFTEPTATNAATNGSTSLSDLGLSFTSDSTKGTFEIAGDAGSTKPTVNNNKYVSKDVDVKWKNAYDGITERTNKVAIKIKPVTPKIKTSKIVYTAGTTTGTQSIELSNIESGDSAALLKFVATSKDFGGVAINSANGQLTFTPANLKATKGTKVTISVDNYGVYGNKKDVTFTINAPKPTISASSPTLDIKGSATAKVEKTVTFTATGASVSGDTKLKWKITTKPDGLGAKIKAGTDANAKTATVTITAKKGSEASGALTLGVTATNSVSKESSEECTVTINATAAPSTDSSTKDGETRSKDTATDEATEPMKEEDVEVGEGKVIRGKARTEAALTATQRTLIAEAGYIVVAVLPEVEVTAAGQYPFPVEIPEEIAAGKELAWFAFSTKPSEDDEIVDFFDEEGKDTKVVPESHKITVYPWLNTDVTYAPVIAVKADNGEEGAETEEQIQEKTVRAVKK